MSNRRSHPRFEVPIPCQATVRIVRNVSVTQNVWPDFVCIGSERGIVGEEVTIEVLGATSRASVRARVTDSRPLPAGGSMRFELRLRALEDTTSCELAPSGRLATTK